MTLPATNVRLSNDALGLFAKRGHLHPPSEESCERARHSSPEL